jgi:hypothetical protein
MELAAILKDHSEGKFQTYLGKESHHVTTSVIVHNDGVIKTASGPCHACVDREMRKGKTVAIITKADSSLADNAGAIAYYDWLINRSFFSDVFLCKDPVLSLKYGFVKTADINAAKWLGAAQLARLSTSEYKQSAKAIYDILASGWEIHPMFLTFLACTTSFSSNGKMIFANSVSFNSYTSKVTNQQTTHLPFFGVSTEQDLIEFCKDDSKKPLSNFLNQTSTFNQAKWPSGSHKILLERNYNFETAVQSITTAIQNCIHGLPSLLFNAKEVGNYKPLWEKAINSLKATLPNKAGIQGKGINLSSLEQLSKQLKLGK